MAHRKYSYVGQSKTGTDRIPGVPWNWGHVYGEMDRQFWVDLGKKLQPGDYYTHDGQGGRQVIRFIGRGSAKQK